MNLLIDYDGDPETGWEGYDFILNRSREDGLLSVERFVDNRWELSLIHILQHCSRRFGGHSGSDDSFLRKLGVNYPEGSHSPSGLCRQKTPLTIVWLLRNRPQYLY